MIPIDFDIIVDNLSHHHNINSLDISVPIIDYNIPPNNYHYNSNTIYSDSYINTTTTTTSNFDTLTCTNTDTSYIHSNSVNYSNRPYNNSNDYGRNSSYNLSNDTILNNKISNNNYSILKISTPVFYPSNYYSTRPSSNSTLELIPLDNSSSNNDYDNNNIYCTIPPSIYNNKNKVIKSYKKYKKLLPSEKILKISSKTKKLTLSIPKILKTDIRRLLPNMIINTFNSCDTTLIRKFSYDFFTPNIRLIEYFFDCKEFNFSPINIIDGVELICKLFDNDFIVFPDMIFKMKNAKIIQDPNSIGSKILIQGEYKGTFTYAPMNKYRPDFSFYYELLNYNITFDDINASPKSNRFELINKKLSDDTLLSIVKNKLDNYIKYRSLDENQLFFANTTLRSDIFECDICVYLDENNSIYKLVFA